MSSSSATVVHEPEEDSTHKTAVSSPVDNKGSHFHQHAEKLDPDAKPQPLAGAQKPSKNTDKSDEGSSSPTNSRPITPNDQEYEAKLDSSGDLQFKKKDFSRSRTQSFQSVLSSASLKSLKQQYTSPKPPQLQRNASTVSQNTVKNFQSFIQAPVLSSVTNLRVDDVEIGQRLPFDHKSAGQDGSGRKSRKSSVFDQNPSREPASGNGKPEIEDSVDEYDEDDIYKEQTTLQQQRLTLNALKKLSLSLAPIIRSDDDASESLPQKLTTNPLNSPRSESRADLRDTKSAKDLRSVVRASSNGKSKPYQPAEVDLSSFSSLTRQNRHLPDTGGQSTRVNSALATGSERSSRLKESTPLGKSLSGPAAPSTDMPSSESHAHAIPQDDSNNSFRAGAEDQASSVANALVGPPDKDSQGAQASIKVSNSVLSSIDVNEPTRSTLSGLTAGQSLSSATQPQTSSVNGQYTPGSENSSRPNKFPTAMGHEHLAQQQRNINKPMQPVSINVVKSVPGEDYRGRNAGVVHDGSQSSAGSRSQIQPSDKKLQQINGLRSPMYVPAVLRKNVENVSEQGSELIMTGDHFSSSPKFNDQAMREEGSSATSIKSLDSVYSNESAPAGPQSKVGPFKLRGGQYEYISKAAPTRNHWLKDESVFECGIGSCRKKFNFFERRHHCRKCGGIFCKEHTSHSLYINHLAQFTTGGRGTLSRVCDNCIQEYNEFIKHEFGVSCQRPSRESSPSQYSSNKIDYRKEIFASKVSNLPVKTSNSNEETKVADQMAGSVPANWSWSSF